MSKASKGQKTYQERKYRVNAVLSMVIEAHALGKSTDKERLIALAQFKFGLARRTSLEYMTTLINAGFVLETPRGLEPTNLGVQSCVPPENYQLTENDLGVLGQNAI